jgi:hypothetical protein
MTLAYRAYGYKPAILSVRLSFRRFDVHLRVIDGPSQDLFRKNHGYTKRFTSF